MWFLCGNFMAKNAIFELWPWPVVAWLRYIFFQLRKLHPEKIKFSWILGNYCPLDMARNKTTSHKESSNHFNSIT